MAKHRSGKSVASSSEVVIRQSQVESVQSSPEPMAQTLRPRQTVRNTVDVDNMIEACTKKLEEEPTHVKALFIRASSLLKKNRP